MTKKSYYHNTHIYISKRVLFFVKMFKEVCGKKFFGVLKKFHHSFVSFFLFRYVLTKLLSCCFELTSPHFLTLSKFVIDVPYLFQLLSELLCSLKNFKNIGALLCFAIEAQITPAPFIFDFWFFSNSSQCGGSNHVRP